MSQIKISRAKKISKWGVYHRTFDAIVENIPSSVIAKITSGEFAELIDSQQAAFNRGKAAEAKEQREVAA